MVESYIEEVWCKITYEGITYVTNKGNNIDVRIYVELNTTSLRVSSFTIIYTVSSLAPTLPTLSDVPFVHLMN